LIDTAKQMQRSENFSDAKQVDQGIERSGKAGVAQLVERNLAKVEVASSSLVSRSKFKGKLSGFPFCLDDARASRQDKLARAR
jgi:hypothetical protein